MGWKYLTRRLHASFRLVELAGEVERGIERERERAGEKEVAAAVFDPLEP